MIYLGIATIYRIYSMDVLCYLCVPYHPVCHPLSHPSQIINVDSSPALLQTQHILHSGQDQGYDSTAATCLGVDKLAQTG
jgi:hypothetical protein